MSNSMLAKLLEDIKELILFNRYFQKRLSKKRFISLVDSKTLEKSQKLFEIKDKIKTWLNPIVEDLDDHADMIDDLMDFAHSLFQSDSDGKSIYVDPNFSKSLYERFLVYFESKRDVLNQLICIHWIIRICYVVNDYDNGIKFFKKAKRFVPFIDDLSSEEADYFTRILDNKTLILSLNPLKNVVPYFRGLLKFYERHDVYSKFMTSDDANFSKFILYNNVVNYGVGVIRSGDINPSKRSDYIKYIYEFALKAKEYEVLVEGGETLSNLTPLMLEISYYNGCFKNKKEYHDAISSTIEGLRDSKSTQIINDNKDEIEMSLYEIDLLDRIDDPNTSLTSKIDTMEKMFRTIFKVVSSSRSSYDEKYFIRYIKIFVSMAAKILSPEEVLCKVQEIFRHVDPYTYVHQINVSAISTILIEDMVYSNPDHFVGVPGIETVDDARIHKDRLVHYGKYSGLFHDIGKLGKLLDIITKLLDLGDSEFLEIKKHVSDGYDIAMSSKETAIYSGPILTHHKDYYGTGGYPEHVPEHVLPYKAFSDILSVADVIDAITDYIGRAYKNRRSPADAIMEIKKGSGTKFNPAVVKLLDNPIIVSKIEHIITEVRMDLLYRVFNGKEIAA